MAEGSGVAIVIVMVTRKRIVSSRWKSQENPVMTEIRGLVTIIASFGKYFVLSIFLVQMFCPDISI